MKILFKRYGAWLFFAISFVSMALFTHHRIFTLHLLNADMSSELVLSRQLFEQGALLTPNWYYSTELRVLSAQMLFAPLFAFFSSWQVVRFVGTLLLYALLAASFLFMARRLHLGLYAPLAAGLLLLPLSPEYFYYVLYGAFYSPHLIVSFLIVGLVLDAPRSALVRVLSILSLLALSLLTGLGGLRQLLLLFAPLFLATLFHILRQCNQQGALRLSAVRVLPGYASLLRAFLALCAACTGYGINHAVLSAHYHFKSFSSISYTPFSFQALGDVLQGFASALGFTPGGLVLGADTVSNAAALLLLLALACALYILWRRRRSLPTAHALLGLYVLWALGLFTLVYVFTDMEYAVRYALPILAFAPAALLAAFQSDALCAPLRRAASLLLVCALCASSALLYRIELSRDYADERFDFAQLCVREGYHAGYATFWNANLLTEYTDGALEVWTMQSRPSTSPADLVKYQQLVSHFTSTPEGKVFVLLETGEFELYGFARNLPQAHLLFEGESFVAFGFESDSQLRALAYP